METKFTERVRFNQLEIGDIFTFRKNGIVNDSDDELERRDTAWSTNGQWHENNIYTPWGGSKINNTRSWVWRVPHEESHSVPSLCKGCINAWDYPVHSKCKYCSRRFTDNYVKKEA